MCKEKFFATTESDISKAAVDFFSIGHIIFGQIVFFIVYALLKYTTWFYWVPPSDVEMWAIIVAIIVGIIWEPIENILLWKMGLKFDNQQDSILNIIFDIIFVVIGSLLAHWINNWVINLVLIIIEFILFEVLRYKFTGTWV